MVGFGSGGGGSVAAPELFLALSLNAAARNPERPPTSLMGAVDLLRSAFAAAKSSAAAGPDVAVLRSALQGNRKVAIAADTLAEIQQALDLARDFGFEPVIVGARDASRIYPAAMLNPQVEVVVTTDDGSAGRKGFVTDPFAELTQYVFVSGS